MSKYRALILRLLRNGSLSVIAETVILSVLLLVTFRVIIRSTDFAVFGVWALLQSLAVTVRMVDVGIGGSLSKYIGQIDWRADRALTWKYVDTGLLFNTGFFLLLALVAYGPLRLVIHASLPPPQAGMAIAALPLVLINLVVTSVAQVPVAALIGIRLSTAKSVANMLGAVTLLLCTILLVRSYGLVGLILAQILQQSVILLSAWVMLSFAVNAARTLRLRLSFDPAIIRQTASVSFAIQSNGMIAGLLDVVIKFALTRWGGAAATGLFELASRFVNVIRSLLVTPTNLAVPPFARALAKGRHRTLARLYSRQMRLLILACCVFYTLALLGSPIISLVVLGRLEPMFFVYFVAQWFASIVNILSAPSAALGVAAGDMRGNIIGTSAMVIGSAVFGNWLGYWHGGMGTLAATTLAVVAGSLLTLAINCARFGLRPFPHFRRGPGGRSSLGGMLSPLVR